MATNKKVRPIEAKKTKKSTVKHHDLNSENWIKVLKLFFDEPATRLHISEVARRTNLTPRGAQNILESLRRDELLKNESNGIVNNFWGNYDNPKFLGLKRSLNLNSLYSTGLITELESFYNNPRCIVLFGSFARGEDTLNSDIDIAVETGQGDVPDLSVYEKILKRPVNVLLIKDLFAENGNFINSLANGIVLSGYLNVMQLDA